jgi:toxin secretion/phage lysis holin
MTTSQKADTMGAGAGVIVAYLFGAIDAALTWLCILMMFDLVSGLLASMILGEKFSLSLLWVGIMKKFLSLVGVVVAQAMAFNTGVPAIRLAIVGALIGYEALSILRNMARGKVFIPSWLADTVQKYIDVQTTSLGGNK